MKAFLSLFKKQTNLIIYFHFGSGIFIFFKELSSRDDSCSCQWNTHRADWAENKLSKWCKAGEFPLNYCIRSCFMVTAWITFQGKQAGVSAPGSQRCAAKLEREEQNQTQSQLCVRLKEFLSFILLVRILKMTYSEHEWIFPSLRD